MNDLTIYKEYNQFPDIISYDDENPSLRSPNAPVDLFFYQTRETFSDIDTYRNFIKNVESRFRRSKYYKLYKSHLMAMGLNRCQVMGNITTEDVGDRGIELHHNILNLFDICILLTEHTLNTIGIISSYDLMQLLILEHNSNRVPIVFLSETAHQMYTTDPEAYIPPSMTFGKWWELLSRYKYGITLDIAYKVLKYMKRFTDQLPISIDVTQQDQLLTYARYNEYGWPVDKCGFINMNQIEGGQMNNG